MKTDAELQREVLAELARDPAVRSPAIGVAVNDGVVTLSGHLDTFAEKYAVENALKRLDDVEAIAVELDVKLSPRHERSDSDIAAAAEQALRGNTLVPHDTIRLMVEHGWVTLQGEVEWDYQRRSIEKSISSLMGVRGLNDQMALRVRPYSADLSRRIEDALAKYALAQFAECKARTGQAGAGSDERGAVNERPAR